MEEESAGSNGLSYWWYLASCELQQSRELSRGRYCMEDGEKREELGGRNLAGTATFR
jgi:hypothetical protein